MPPKQWNLSTKLHGIISQSRAFFASIPVQLAEYWSFTPLIVSGNHGFNIKKKNPIQAISKTASIGPQNK